MNQSTWASDVCAQATSLLSPAPSEPVEPGGAFVFRGVEFEMLLEPTTGTMLLNALMSPVAEEHKAEVYQQMLYIQLMAWQSAVVRFGFDPSRDIPLLFTALPPRPECDGLWLARVIEAVADQVNDWNETLLAGTAVTASAGLQPPGAWRDPGSAMTSISA